MTTLLLVSAVLLAQAPAEKAAPPLTDEQTARLRELVKMTQTEADEINSKLAERQRALVRVYDAYELNVRAAEQIQAEIVELQRRQLANYHRMQVELRATVSAERFATLKQRLAGVIGPAGRKAPESPKKSADK
jgi:hypothetical protein